jgi:FAD-dependent urate hydroxylase
MEDRRMNHCRILIVGAGLAGLSLARALRQAGLAPQVIEREAGRGGAGTGIYLPANGVRALRTLGLEGAVAARGTRIPSQRLLDHRGHLLADIDLHRLWADVGPCLALPRTKLHQILREGVPVRLGRTIRSLEHLDGPVQVGFDDGSGGDYDLVIGADGLRSSVRRLAVDPRLPVPVGQHSWRFLAACPPQVITWTVMLGPGTSFLTVPVGPGLVYCYADVTADPAGGGERDGDPIGRLRQRFAGYAAPVPQLLDQLEDPARVHVAPIEQVVEERWGRGAVLLVGDAAHGMSPNMAQGAALAFEDALVLAACLRDAARSPTRWPPSSPGGTGARAGSAPRPTAATAPATSHQSYATSSCGPSDDRSSSPTTNPCEHPSSPPRRTHDHPH